MRAMIASALLIVVAGCSGSGDVHDTAADTSTDTGAIPPSATVAANDSVFVDRGACPFECCTYGRWTADSAVALRAEPDSASPVIATIEKGASVRVPTGEVHVIPGRFVVRRDIETYRTDTTVPTIAGTFSPGDTLLVYTYRGEGAWKLRKLGSSEPLVEAMLAERGTGCEQGGTCDGYFIAKPRSTWWVRIRPPTGEPGWTADADAFSGKDACG